MESNSEAIIFFIQNAIPNELPQVILHLKKIFGENITENIAIKEALIKKYSTIVEKVKVEDLGEMIISPSSQVINNRINNQCFLDSKTNKIFEVNINKQGKVLGNAVDQPLDDVLKIKDLFILQLSQLIKEEYQNITAATTIVEAFPHVDMSSGKCIWHIYAIVRKQSFKNLWSLEFVHKYYIEQTGENEGTIQGTCQWIGHYFENGNAVIRCIKNLNLQLISNNLIEESLKSIKGIITQIKQKIPNFFQELTEQYWNKLRRRLPVSKQTYHWGTGPIKIS